jgi:hypothetical protein
LLDTALGVGAGVEAGLDEDADADGAPVPDAKVVGPTDEQSEISGTTPASCACAELVELTDGEALADADGEDEALADGEPLAEADGEQVDSGEPEPASPADGDEPLPGTGLISQMNVADPAAPVVSVAVTVTSLAPAVVGVPVIWPADEIDRPGGSPVAV